MFRFLIYSLMALQLAGCASAIKTYDSTFTKTNSHAFTLSQNASGATGSKQRSNRPYFMEFRARSAHSYGHASLVFGLLDENGRVPVDDRGVLIPGMTEITGLHPATTSIVSWSAGHIVPVPAETGPSDGDFEDAFITARFRIDLSKAEFAKLVAVVREHKRKSNVWYAPVFETNCLGYIASIARQMGLRTPHSAAFPKEYVMKLARLNQRS